MFLTLLVVVLYNLVMANNNKRSFYVNGELLRKIIESKGLTQADVYKAINIGENTIYRVIKFSRMESKDDFNSMCKYLDIDPNALLRKDYISSIPELKNAKNDISNLDLEKIENYINPYPNGKGFHSFGSTTFTDSYIERFFNNSPGSEMLSKEQKEMFFKKIIDTREKFIGLYFEYFDVADDKEREIGFEKMFEDWFKRNITDNNLKD